MGTQEGEGKYFIWEKKHGLLVLKENHKISMRTQMQILTGP